MTDKYLKTNKDLREHIGKMVYWDSVCSRYVRLMQGTITAVTGKNVEIDGDWKYRPNLLGLRNFANGGTWGKTK